MKYDREHIEQLWILFLSNQATKSEVSELLAAIKDLDGVFDNDWLYDRFIRVSEKSSGKVTSDRELNDILQMLSSSDAENSDSFKQVPATVVPAPSSRRVPYLRRWWAAASIILVLGMGAYLWTAHKKDMDSATVAQQPRDILPGKDGAILTLADGSTVVLDSLGNGVIATQNGVDVVLTDSRLTYDPTGESSTTVAYNTMRTPKGRQFQLLLPDGTRVWLNAASSLRYPTVFTGGERKVEITGEAYFEVAKNAQLPFRVKVNDQAEIEVLGTQFNVNAYENEGAVNTTLLEGSVKVNGTTIRPGQQAQIANDAGNQPEIKVINKADIDKVMAWKNGLISFDGATFDEIMRQVERWYDIKVVYENNKVPDIRLAGKMTRDVSLNGLLKYLGKMDGHYRLDDRTLIVSP